MKKWMWPALLALGFLWILGSSFEEAAPLTGTISTIKNKYLQELDAFAVRLEQLDHAAAELPEATDATALQAAFKAARIQYKRVEHLLAYLDEEAVKRHINGAPLPSLEPKVPGVHVLAPEGLQTIDELVFGDAPKAAQAEIRALTQKLVAEYKTIQAFQRQTHIDDRNVFEAFRQQILRILSLGITGFDTPGSLHALPEARASLVSMHEDAAVYYPHIRKANKPALVEQVEGHFEAAIAFLEEASSFDAFDRLTFTRWHLQPLYALFLDMHTTLGIETAAEVQPGRARAVNYNSTQIFSDNFLNPNYYAGLSTGVDHSAKRALGRLLFFDPILSLNNERACASCHNGQLGFADGVDKGIAIGFKGRLDRNAQTALNSVFAGRYFHDMRTDRPAKLVEHVILNPKEFASDYPLIISRLTKSKAYKKLFKKAFPGQRRQPINKMTITTALTAYLAELRSFNAPFDRYMRGEQDDIEEAVRRGFNIFMGKGACGTCHFAPTFAGLVPPDFHESESEVLGVPEQADKTNAKIDPDKGRAANNRPAEAAEHYVYSFKTPTVRNIEYTAPYMHNGVYETLEQVMEFYNDGGGAGLGIELEHQTLAPDALNLTEAEQQDVIAFMKSLSDTVGLTSMPTYLPKIDIDSLNDRTIGGTY